MAALMTASEQVQNTDVVSLVNAGRIVEAAQAAGTVYGPPPPPPAPYMDRLARYNSMGSKGKVSEAFSQLATELTTGTSPYAVKPSHMKKVMARWRPDFQGYAQHDAHEFLVLTRRLFPNVSELQVASTASRRRDATVTPSTRPHESPRAARGSCGSLATLSFDAGCTKSNSISTSRLCPRKCRKLLSP